MISQTKINIWKQKNDSGEKDNPPQRIKAKNTLVNINTKIVKTIGSVGEKEKLSI